MDHRAWTDVDAHFAALALENDPVLDDVERASREAGLPPIAISPLQGGFLAMLVGLTGARRILEVGTLGGFSAICMARALPEDGRLVTLEVDEHHADVARRNVERAGLTHRVDIVLGDAHRSLEGLEAGFDFVFLDADKRSYPEYLEASIGLCRPGALIVADNVVRDGRILDATDDDPDLIGMRAFIESGAKDPRLESAYLQTVGVKGWDGFAFLRVKD